jgi:hypothetical protein
MKVSLSFETSETALPTTQRHIPEYIISQSHRYENLVPCKYVMDFENSARLMLGLKLRVKQSTSPAYHISLALKPPQLIERRTRNTGTHLLKTGWLYVACSADWKDSNNPRLRSAKVLFNTLKHKVCLTKVKQSHYRPGQALRVPGVEAPRFLHSRHMKVVRLPALGTGRLYPQEIFLVLISVRRWVDPRATVRPVGLCQWKIPLEPATLQLAAQCLKQLRHRVLPFIPIWSTQISLGVLFKDAVISWYYSVGGNEWMSVERWWNDPDRGKLKYWERHLSI